MQRAAFTYVTTANELSVLRKFAAGAAAGYIENGVDTDFFDGSPRPVSEWERRRFVAFIGAMDYHPNIEGARWFASEVFPSFRRRVPDLEFLIVGRNPAKPVRELAAAEGVHVLGGVPDVRPFLAAARAITAPLRLARGIQNKVLEALAMGREVFASPEVCGTFGGAVPTGVVECRSAEDYIRRIEFASAREPECTAAIRSGVRERFDWETNLAPLCSKLESLLSQTAIGVRV
jgi:glycosyltransferase involved in cell wall biosynthesis